MTLELYRPRPDGEIVTLMLWHKSDKLPEVIKKYTALLAIRGIVRFSPTRAVVRSDKGNIKARWPRLATARTA